jgi:hypothetical protein
MQEPKRNNDINTLVLYIIPRVNAIMRAMQSRGFDPVIFEAKRTDERQKWLYGIGRTHHKTQRPVTWTMQSKHLVGKAVDIISKTRLWDWEAFYDALEEEAKKHGMHTIPNERCHIQYG